MRRRRDPPAEQLALDFNAEIVDVLRRNLGPIGADIVLRKPPRGRRLVLVTDHVRWIRARRSA